MFRKNSHLGLLIVFMILTVGLLTTTGWITVQSKETKTTLEETKTQLEASEKVKIDLEGQVKNLTTEKADLQKQIEALDVELQKLKEEGINVTTEVENEDRKVAYLTFDDGPSANTIKILDFLKANNIKATFFVLEKEGYDDIYKRIVEEGHTIAIHSSSHNYSEIYKNVDAFMADVSQLSEHIKELTGVDAKVLRFPGGSNNTVSYRYGGKNIMNDVIEAVEEAGYVYFDWNVDSMDAAKGLQDTNVIVNSVLNQSAQKDNPVILMHDAAAKTTTVEALPAIVEGLKELGFVFEPLTTESEVVQFK